MLGTIYMSPEEMIESYGLTVTDKSGDITFYKDKNETLYQQIKNGEIFKLANGGLRYRKIKSVNKYLIKYNTNGVYGFAIFRGKIPLEDRIWSMSEAEQIAKTM